MTESQAYKSRARHAATWAVAEDGRRSGCQPGCQDPPRSAPDGSGSPGQPGVRRQGLEPRTCGLRERPGIVRRRVARCIGAGQPGPVIHPSPPNAVARRGRGCRRGCHNAGLRMRGRWRERVHRGCLDRPGSRCEGARGLAHSLGAPMPSSMMTPCLSTCWLPGPAAPTPPSRSSLGCLYAPPARHQALSGLGAAHCAQRKAARTPFKDPRQLRK